MKRWIIFTEFSFSSQFKPTSKCLSPLYQSTIAIVQEIDEYPTEEQSKNELQLLSIQSNSSFRISSFSSQTSSSLQDQITVAPSERRYQTQRSNSQSPSNLKEDLKIYEKPLNPHYSEKFKREVEHSHNLNQQFDMKNLDIKTDGSVIKYKPEYHQSRVQNITRIFPQLESTKQEEQIVIENKNQESRGVLSTPIWNEKRFRKAIKRRERAKAEINQRKECLRHLLVQEQHIRPEI